jgi:hypothetical protein
VLEDFVGGAAEIRLRPPAPYGTEPDDVLLAESMPAGADAPERWLAVLFSLAQSPEEEVHGELLRRLGAWTSAGEPGRRRSLVVVDAGPYRLRLAGTGAEERRLAERRRAWDLVARPSGSAIAHLDLENGVDDAALLHLERAARSSSPGR